MGNSFGTSNKPLNSANVSLSVRNFVAHSLPQKPSQWTQRIDERTWNEFIDICLTSTRLPDISQRLLQYKMWSCRNTVGFVLFIIGVVSAQFMCSLGGRFRIAAVWISGIIIGVIGVFGGAALFFVSKNKYSKINRRFIADVRYNLCSKLMPLNNKYNGIIRFSYTGTDTMCFKKIENAETVVNIKINIKILAQTVEYIPYLNGHDSIHSQPYLNAHDSVVEPQTVQVASGEEGYNQPPVVVVQQPYTPGASGEDIEPQSIAAAFVPDEPVPPAYNTDTSESEGEEGAKLLDENSTTYEYQIYQ